MYGYIDMNVEGFPAQSRHASVKVENKTIDVVTVGFSDKISVMVNVDGKVSSMVSGCI